MGKYCKPQDIITQNETVYMYLICLCNIEHMLLHILAIYKVKKVRRYMHTFDTFFSQSMSTILIHNTASGHPLFFPCLNGMKLSSFPACRILYALKQRFVSVRYKQSDLKCYCHSF